MIPKTYEEIIKNIENKTEENNANWHTTARENEFIIYFKEFSLSVSTHHDADQEISYVQITMYSEDGIPIDYFTIEDRDTEYNYMYNFYQSAKRKALNIDEALNQILSEVKKEGIIGEKNTSSDPNIPF